MNWLYLFWLRSEIRIMYKWIYPKKKFEKLSMEQKKFMAKVIMNDVKQIALEQKISEQLAYDLYSKGLFGFDKTVS